MPKSATASGARYPRDHSKKGCVCGGHSTRDRKRQKRKVGRETVRKALDDLPTVKKMLDDLEALGECGPNVRG